MPLDAGVQTYATSKAVTAILCPQKEKPTDRRQHAKMAGREKWNGSEPGKCSEHSLCNGLASEFSCEKVSLSHS